MILDWFSRRRAAKHAHEEALVAEVLAKTPNLSGYPLSQATGLGAGQIYVVLARMERAGTVVSEWKPGPYPRRRLYRLAAPAYGEER